MEHRLFVVVVDDDPSVCKALTRLLRSAQMEVEAHASAEEFLRALKQREPDCLILDVRMPVMTGPELRHKLFELGHRLPIVFITAHAEEVAQASAAEKRVDVLHKPFDGQTLLDAIQRAIKRSAGT